MNDTAIDQLLWKYWLFLLMTDIASWPMKKGNDLLVLFDDQNDQWQYDSR